MEQVSRLSGPVLASRGGSENRAIWFYSAVGITTTFDTFFCNDRLASDSLGDVVLRIRGSSIAAWLSFQSMKLPTGDTIIYFAAEDASDDEAPVDKLM